MTSLKWIWWSSPDVPGSLHSHVPSIRCMNLAGRSEVFWVASWHEGVFLKWMHTVQIIRQALFLFISHGHTCVSPDPPRATHPDDTRTATVLQYAAHPGSTTVTTAPTPTQPAASFPGARTVPAPQYALAEHHPKYGYSQSGVNGTQNQLRMVTMKSR